MQVKYIKFMSAVSQHSDI